MCGFQSAYIKSKSLTLAALLASHSYVESEEVSFRSTQLLKTITFLLTQCMYAFLFIYLYFTFIFIFIFYLYIFTSLFIYLLRKYRRNQLLFSITMYCKITAKGYIFFATYPYNHPPTHSTSL